MYDIDTQASNSESYVEGEVDLRTELVSSLEELEKCRKKNKQSVISQNNLFDSMKNLTHAMKDMNIIDKFESLCFLFW